MPPVLPTSFIATVEAQPRQTIKGWGIYPCTIQLDRPNAENFTIFNRPNAQRLLFKELGMSYFRTELLPGSYDAKRDDGSLDTAYLDATLVRWLRLARSYGHTKYILSVWSPPAVFKDPPATLGSRKGVATRLRPDREDAYCRYIVRALNHLTRARGLAAPLTFSIQNEPDAAPAFWNGTVYDGPQWRRVVKKMRAVLDAGGYRGVGLIGPEGGMYSVSLDRLGGPGVPELKKDPTLAKALSGFAFHGYGGGSRLAPNPEQLRDAAAIFQASGKDVWMSEWCVTVPKSPLEHTLRVAQRLGRETAYIPTNYWTWWQGWYFSHPKSEVLLTGPDDRKLHISKTYHFLKKLWHSAPAGSVVHRVDTGHPVIRGYDADTVQTVAFEGSGRLTVMIVNPGGESLSLKLLGLGAGKASVYRTDERRDMERSERLPVKGGEINIDLPVQSVTLVVVQRPNTRTT